GNGRADGPVRRVWAASQGGDVRRRDLSGRGGGRRLRRAGPGGFSELGGAQLFAPGWVERPQPPHALRHRWVRDEERREAFLGERIDRVERLRRGAGLKLVERAGLLAAAQRNGKPEGRLAERGR